ncbi:MAG: hypothetical protein AAGJ09_15460 [Pseudomonadota bacterium]
MAIWAIRLLLLVLPVAILLYWLSIRQKAAQSGEDMSRKERSIAIAGVIVSLVTLLALIFTVPFSGHSTDSIYIPPRTVDGQIVPGEFITREEAEARGLLDKAAPPRADEFEPFGD